jgi:hypothetical protein
MTMTSLLRLEWLDDIASDGKAATGRSPSHSILLLWVADR